MEELHTKAKRANLTDWQTRTDEWLVNTNRLASASVSRRFRYHRIHCNCQEVGDGGRRIKFSKPIQLTYSKLSLKNTNTGMSCNSPYDQQESPKICCSLPWWLPRCYRLNSWTRYTAQWHRNRAPPKHNAHTSNTHACAYTHIHTQTVKFITWLFLSLPAWKGSLAIATNHKRGSMFETVVSQRFLRSTAVWEDRQHKFLNLICCCAQFTAIIIYMELCVCLFAS